MTRPATQTEIFDHNHDLRKHDDGVRFPMQVHLNDLKLADVVELFEGPFGTAVVTQITGDEVTLTRPYGVTLDFSYTGGVPYSVGNEVCKYLKCDMRYTAKSHTFKVWQRKVLR